MTEKITTLTVQKWGNSLAVRIPAAMAHQPKSFDWRERKAKIHPWKRAPKEVFTVARELLNQIILLPE